MFHLPLPASPEEVLEQIKDPHSSEDFFHLGLALTRLGRKHQSESMFRKALQCNMRHSPSLYGLAYHAFHENREREAKSWLTRAIRFDSDAEENVLWFQRELKNLSSSPDALRWRIWSLQQLEGQKKASPKTLFEIAKLLFEQSNYRPAIEYFRQLLSDERYRKESAEYLSYLYEHLYRGEELIEKNLDLIADVENRADLFFNLGMAFQHDQRQMELALHFFYLAAEQEPHDPGLRYSLEQAAMEVIADSKRLKNKDPFLMMIAHLYQGSIGVAEKYAADVKNLRFPSSFESRFPQKLWKDWLLKNEGTLGKFLKTWFSEVG